MADTYVPYSTELRTLRERLDQRFNMLKSQRSEFEGEWRDIQRLVAPRRGRFDLGQRRTGRGVTKDIINNTATDAVRICANGLAANLVNPATSWFRMAPEDDELNELGEVRTWLDFVEKRVTQILARSGFYANATVAFHELVLFGTAALASCKDFETVIRWEPWTCGQYYLAQGKRGQADVAYREWQVTVETLIAEFGPERCSVAVRNQWDNGNLDHLVPIRQAIEPYSVRFASRPSLRRWAYVSAYWDPADNERDRFLRIGGYSKQPVFAPRWELVPPDAYGWGPVQDALGDIAGLQVVETSLTRGIERKMGNSGWQGPPIGFDGGNLNGLGQGEDDYNPVPGSTEIKPLIDARTIQLADAEWYHAKLEERIQQTCFVNLFRMFMERDRSAPLTATETIERAREKLLLGPVLHQINSEFLQPIIDGLLQTLFEESQPFWARAEAGMLPIPPKELQGQQLKIEYISELQQAQRMTRAEPIYRLASFVAEFGQVDPTLPMKVDLHQCADELSLALGTPAKVIRDDQTVMAMLKEQQAAQQEQVAMQQQQVEADTIAKLGSASTEPGTALGDLKRAA